MPGPSLRQRLGQLLGRAAPSGPAPIPLHQYWHQGTPPDDVMRLIAEWQSAPGFAHHLYDQAQGLALTRKHFGDRAAACFEACAIPAMQADLFRYVALYAHGGLYLDADYGRADDDLAAYLHSLPVGLICRRTKGDPAKFWFINDICHVRDPGHPLFAKVVELACRNIEAREETNVWSVTGPWLFNEIRETPDVVLFDGFTHDWHQDMKRFVRPVGNLAYKRGPDDWRRVEKDGRSMYT